MNTTEIVEALKISLLPKVYVGFELSDAETFFAIFKGRDFIISRYLLALSHVQQERSLVDHVTDLRNEIKLKFKAGWFFREIGLHIILFTENSSLNEQFTKVKSDTFGNHAVIIQGIHLVDIRTKSIMNTQSQWGPLKFGKGRKIDTSLKEIINNA